MYSTLETFYILKKLELWNASSFMRSYCLVKSCELPIFWLNWDALQMVLVFVYMNKV